MSKREGVVVSVVESDTLATPTYTCGELMMTNNSVSHDDATVDASVEPTVCTDEAASTGAKCEKTTTDLGPGPVKNHEYYRVPPL